MARKKFSLEAQQSAFSDENKGRTNNAAGKFFNFFNMDYDTSCTVRFLPDQNEANPKGFLVEKKMHRLEINGEVENVPCLTMYKEDCPICQTAKSFYDEGDKVNGKKFYRSLNHIGQVLVKKDSVNYDDDADTCEGKVKAISISWQIYAVMKQAIADNELEEAPCDFDEGTDFIIKKTKNGEWAKYDLGTKFAKRESALTEEEIEIAEAGMVDLATLLPEKPSFEKVNAKLHSALTGSFYEEEDEDEDEDEAPKPKAKAKPAKRKVVLEDDEDEDEAPAPRKKKVVEEVVDEDDADEDEDEDEDETPAPRKKKAAVVEDDDEDEDEDEDSSSVLAKLRARRAKMKKD